MIKEDKPTNIVEMVNDMELYGKPGMLLPAVLQMRSFEMLLKAPNPVQTRQTFWQRTQSLYAKMKLACAKPEWKDSVFLPSQVWLGALENYPQVLEVNSFDPVKYQAIFAVITCVATWRYSQGVYRFDPYVYKNLFSHNIGGVISPSLTRNLPEWCIYIDTPNFDYEGKKVNGVFVLRNYANEYFETMEPDQLIIVMDIQPFYDKNDGSFTPQPYAVFSTNFLKDVPLQEAYTTGLAGVGPSGNYIMWDKTTIENVFNPIISLINSICINSMPVESDAIIGLKPNYKDYISSYVQFIDGQKEFKIKPPSNPRVWSVGYPIGISKRHYEDRKLFSKIDFTNMELHWFINQFGTLGLRTPSPFSIELISELNESFIELT